MNISSLFIKKPVMTVLVMISILLFGYISYRILPVSDLPNVDYPTILVTVVNPGSNPQTMAATCATPLEREFMTIDGINNITSNSVLGKTSLVIQFNLDKSMDTASLDVEAAINRATPNLPPDLPYNPTYNKVNPTATPILYLAISSPSMPLSKLYDFANTNIGQRLTMIEGVSQVQTFGSPYAARIQVNPEKLAGMNLDINDVATSITEANVELPTGKLYGDKNEFTIDVDGQLFDAEGYENIVIKSEDGAIVKISQIGKALDSLKDDKYYLNYKNKKEDVKCVVLAVRKQPGQNTVRVIAEIDKLLPTIMRQLPSSLRVHRVFDKSKTIIDSVNDVKLTLIIAFILVVVIIYLYLGKFLNTLIPILTIPISIFGTFAVMYLLNFSIDILSMLAITLAIGFLIDDAIVVLENNVRHVQMGKTPLEATLEGSKEISSTVLSMTICLISVFIPLIFMGGIVGRLFQEFALTIATIVLISGIISLTLTPLLCSKFIAPYDKEKKKNIIERFSNKLNDKMLGFYAKSLKIVLNYKKTAISVGIFCIIGALLLFKFLPKEFLPDEDMGFLMGYTEAQDGTSPHQMAEYQKTISDIVMQNPAVESLVAAASTSTDNEGLLFIKLKPYNKRKPFQKIINSLMKDLYPIAGVNSYVSTLPLINLQEGTQAKALYQYALTSLDQNTLNHYANEMLLKMRKIHGFTQVSSDLQINQPQLNFEILRDKASFLNISAAKIERFLMHCYTDKKISTINSDINQYDVIVETLPSYYKDPSTISKLYIKSDDNSLVPMQEVVKLNETVGPLSVNHLNGMPSATISFNLSHLPLSSAVKNLEKISKTTLPTAISAEVQGTANVFKKSFQNLAILLIITVFVIYVILGILYENFIHPLTVMSTLAPAGFGGLLVLLIFNQILSLYSFVGLILLIGIVMKNGIMMVDFANDNLKEHQSAHDAIYNACLVRFRPIMMTSIAAFMGALPIALTIRVASALSSKSLGLVITGRLISSQILTLYLTPVTYILLQTIIDKIKTKLFKKKPELG